VEIITRKAASALNPPVLVPVTHLEKYFPPEVEGFHPSEMDFS
jgi:hypothetical protein